MYEKGECFWFPFLITQWDNINWPGKAIITHALLKTKFSHPQKCTLKLTKMSTWVWSFPSFSMSTLHYLGSRTKGVNGGVLMQEIASDLSTCVRLSSIDKVHRTLLGLHFFTCFYLIKPRWITRFLQESTFFRSRVCLPIECNWQQNRKFVFFSNAQKEWHQ